MKVYFRSNGRLVCVESVQSDVEAALIEAMLTAENAGVKIESGLMAVVK